MIVTVRKIDPSIIERARRDAEALGRLRNSITNGGGNLAACVGEELVAEYTGARIERTFDYDLILGDKRIDVKTKRTTVVPLERYECSVADFNTTQKCDLYAFARVTNDFSRAWLLGCIPKEFFYMHARFLKKSQIDGSNNFTVKADCYNVFVHDLLPLPARVAPASDVYEWWAKKFNVKPMVPYDGSDPRHPKGGVE